MDLNSKYIDFILRKLDKKHWNTFSLFLSNLTYTTISSPIKIQEPNGLLLQEYENISNLPRYLRSKFFNFCYPIDMKNREEEILYDKEYLSVSSIFIVFNTKKGNEIVGCALFIPKTNNNKLPVENSYIVNKDLRNKTHFNAMKDSNNQKVVEIYRLRRSFSISRRKIPSLVNMLFKAVWNKAIQTKTKYIYLSCKYDSEKFRNLYMKKLHFLDTKLKISYDGKTVWSVFKDNCSRNDRELATLSRSQFKLQTYFRSNAKNNSNCKSTFIPKFAKTLANISIPIFYLLKWFYIYQPITSKVSSKYYPRSKLYSKKPLQNALVYRSTKVKPMVGNTY